MKTTNYSIFNLKSIGRLPKELILSMVLLLSIMSNVAYAQLGNSELNSLLTEINPTIYIQNGRSSLHGDGDPKVLVCDIASVSSLYYEDGEFGQVRLIKIKVNSNEQLPEIYIANFISFLSLQYIYIEYQFDVCGNMSESCLEQLIQSQIINTNSNISIHTGLSIPN